MSTSRWFPLGGALLLAACQAAPVVGPGPAASASPAASTSPAATASPGPAGSVAPSTVPSATAAPTAQRELVLGSIYNERGGLVEAAQIIIDADDPALDRTIEATGGAFALRDVPVGTTLSVTATAPGFTSRTRRHTVKPVVAVFDEAPNRVDFGAPGPSFWYYLTREFDIARTVPENLAQDERREGLEIAFEFSSAVPDDERGDFSRLIRVRVPGSAEEDILTTRTTVGNHRALVEWSDGGRRAVFSFPMPIVVRSSDAAIVVDLDPDADPEEYPKDGNGRRLGIDRVEVTQDGSGSRVRNRVAPFARPVINEPVPSTRPSPLTMWGVSHLASIRFTRALDLTPPKLTRVRPLDANDEDVLVLTFDKPVYGYPARALANGTTSTSSYRVVVGRMSDADSRERFEETDVRTAGNGPREVEFDERAPNTMILHFSGGHFDDQSRYKLFVSPAVEDVYGASVGAEGIVMEGDL